MHTNLWFWIIFNVSVLFLLAIDLFAFQRKAHAPSLKEATIWTLVWATLSLGFNALVWNWMGPAKALEFLTGYLIEYSLSVDNIFVFSSSSFSISPCRPLTSTWCSSGVF